MLKNSLTSVITVLLLEYFLIIQKIPHLNNNGVQTVRRIEGIGSEIFLW